MGRGEFIKSWVISASVRSKSPASRVMFMDEDRRVQRLGDTLIAARGGLTGRDLHRSGQLRCDVDSSRRCRMADLQAVNAAFQDGVQCRLGAVLTQNEGT